MKHASIGCHATRFLSSKVLLMLFIFVFMLLLTIDLFILFCRNYVIQFILELKIPAATANLISQFEGNYVHLSTQRFSSHVVEKCLTVFTEENQSRIVHELLSTSHFEQLLQHPHANYVIQKALHVYEVRKKLCTFSIYIAFGECFNFFSFFMLCFATCFIL